MKKIIVIPLSKILIKATCRAFLNAEIKDMHNVTIIKEDFQNMVLNHKNIKWSEFI